MRATAEGLQPPRENVLPTLLGYMQTYSALIKEILRHHESVSLLEKITKVQGAILEAILLPFAKPRIPKEGKGYGKHKEFNKKRGIQKELRRSTAPNGYLKPRCQGFVAQQKGSKICTCGKHKNNH